MRKIVVILVLLSLFLVAYDREGGGQESQTQREEMLTYLEDKYGETFEVETFTLENWPSRSYSTLLVRPTTGEEGKSFEVRRTEEDGRVDMQDAYAYLAYYPYFQAEYADTVKEYFDQSIVHVQVPQELFFAIDQREGLTYDEVKEALKTNRVFARLILVADSKSSEGSLADLQRDLAGRFAKGAGRVYFFHEDFYKEVIKKDLEKEGLDYVLESLSQDYRNEIVDEVELEWPEE